MNGPLIQNVLGARPAAVERADGVWLWDSEGNRYLDGCSGAVVSAIGHGHPHVVEAIAAQAAKVTYAHRGAFTNAPAEEVARRLCDMTGMAGAWLVGSGSEAVEAAMQFALQYHRETGSSQRTLFLSAKRGYHGNTLGALSASGHARRRAVEGLALDIPSLPAGDALRDRGDRSEEEYASAMLEEAARQVAACGDRLAGVLIEPVGGATLGATTHPAGYLAGLKRLCEEAGALFLADEVLCGMGRTGTVLACESEGVAPDLVAMGKGLGSGYAAVAATLVAPHVLSAIEEGSGTILGGHTYAGNPLTAATALAVLEVIESEDVIARGREAARMLRASLERLAADSPQIREVRGRGMLLAIELDSGGRPQGDTVSDFASACMKRGLIVYPATGGFVDAALISPPLVITEEEIHELISMLAGALADMARAAALGDDEKIPTPGT